MSTEKYETGVSPPQAAWSWTEALVVLCLQFALVGIIYRHTLQLAFLSDAWVYLGHLRRGVWTTVTTPIGCWLERDSHQRNQALPNWMYQAAPSGPVATSAPICMPYLRAIS